MRNRWLYLGLLLFLLIDIVLVGFYLFGQRRYPFIKACPVKSFFCLGGKTLNFPKTKAVGFQLKPGQPFYAVADGTLANVAVGSGPRRAAGYILRLDNGLEINYVFPLDSKHLPDEEPAGRLFPEPEAALGRKVKAGQVIGWMGKKKLARKFYGQANLVISLSKPGKVYQFPPLEAKDLWGR